MITHRPPTYLDTTESPDKDVSVYFANDPTRKAVLFIREAELVVGLAGSVATYLVKKTTS